MGAIRSAEMTEALRLIFHEGKTAAQAATATGITKGAISKNVDYRAHVNAQRAARGIPVVATPTKGAKKK